MTHRLPWGTRAGYGFGSVATGSFGAVPGLLLLPYLTDELGVSAAWAGLLVAVPKVWDVIFNPIVGRFSDRRGPASRRGTLLVGGLALSGLFSLIFVGPASTGWGAAWAVSAYFACATAYAFFQVPYMALPAELTDSPQERTHLMTWRVAVLAVAILASGGLAPIIRGAAGYAGVGVFVGALIALGVVGTWAGTRTVPLTGAPCMTGTLRAQFAVVAGHRAFRALLLTWVIQALATGSMLAGVDYVAREVLHHEGASSVLFVCFVGPALVVAPVWRIVALKRTKSAGYLAASGVLAAGMVATYFTLGAGVLMTALTLAVVGVGYAGIQLFPMSMLPDIAADDARTSGENRAGIFTGVWTAGETLGLALGPFLFAAILAWGGYVSPAPGSFVWQSPDAANAIRCGFTFVPAALVAVSGVGLRQYRRSAHHEGGRSLHRDGVHDGHA